MQEHRSTGTLTDTRPDTDGNSDNTRGGSRLCQLDENPRELKVYDVGKVRVKGALIAQFAANDPVVFADAVELISPYVDGVDLNCGK